MTRATTQATRKQIGDRRHPTDSIHEKAMPHCCQISWLPSYFKPRKQAQRQDAEDRSGHKMSCRKYSKAKIVTFRPLGSNIKYGHF